VLSAVIVSSAQAGGDAAHGKTLFGRCAACHSATTQNKVGPGLAGVFGRPAGTVPNFRYSKAMVGYAKRWDDQLAAYVSASFKTQALANYGHEAINLIGKIVSAATLWYGARLVMDQQLSVGQFVAFNMFAQRVAQPIMRMAQLWTDFQQTGISMARLGDILNTRTEVPASTAAQLPPLKGRIQFDQVSFRYRPEAPPVLHSLSIDIRPGHEFIWPRLGDVLKPGNYQVICKYHTYVHMGGHFTVTP